MKNLYKVNLYEVSDINSIIQANPVDLIIVEHDSDKDTVRELISNVNVNVFSYSSDELKYVFDEFSAKRAKQDINFFEGTLCINKSDLNDLNKLEFDKNKGSNPSLPGYLENYSFNKFNLYLNNRAEMFNSKKPKYKK